MQSICAQYLHSETHGNPWLMMLSACIQGKRQLNLVKWLNAVIKINCEATEGVTWVLAKFKMATWRGG